MADIDRYAPAIPGVYLTAKYSIRSHQVDDATYVDVNDLVNGLRLTVAEMRPQNFEMAEGVAWVANLIERMKL